MQDCHSCDPGSIPGVGATLFLPLSLRLQAETQQLLPLWSPAGALPKTFTKEITFATENENFLRSIVHVGRGNRFFPQVARPHFIIR